MWTYRAGAHDQSASAGCMPSPGEAASVGRLPRAWHPWRAERLQAPEGRSAVRLWDRPPLPAGRWLRSISVRRKRRPPPWKSLSASDTEIQTLPRQRTWDAEVTRMLPSVRRASSACLVLQKPAKSCSCESTISNTLTLECRLALTCALPCHPWRGGAHRASLSAALRLGQLCRRRSRRLQMCC